MVIDRDYWSLKVSSLLRAGSQQVTLLARLPTIRLAARFGSLFARWLAC